MAGLTFISDKIKMHEGFEDNMKACLYAAEKHGVVFGQEIEDRESLINTARWYLPEYSVTERVNPDCYMIKQTVIDMFGEPDLSVSDEAAALTDYCNKINRYGYSAVVAHKALYSRKQENAETKEKKRRTDSKTQMTTPTVSPELHFIELLDREYYPKKRILFECTNLPATHCGTTEVMLSAFEAFVKLYSNKYDISMLTNREAAEYHSLAKKYENIVYPDTISGTYHLGYVPVQMHQYESQLLLSRHCLKIAQQVLDIIMVRSYRNHDLAARANIDLGVRFSDGITFISNFSRDDFMAYYANENFSDKIFKTIYVAKEITDTVKNGYKLPFEDYILIAGNTFKHKVINETLEIASKTPHNYIVVGARKTGKIHANIYGYRSGQLEESFISCLYSGCKAVLFPSVYEGFGLPIVMGVHNSKPVIVNNNELNRELCGHFSDFKEGFIFFNTFEQLSEILRGEIKQKEIKGKYTDTWEKTATELESFFEEVLNEKVNLDKIKQRWWTYANIEEKSALHQFRDYKMSSLLRFSLKENIKHRHKKLFKMLKKVKGSW